LRPYSTALTAAGMSAIVLAAWLCGCASPAAADDQDAVPELLYSFADALTEGDSAALGRLVADGAAIVAATADGCKALGKAEFLADRSALAAPGTRVETTVSSIAIVGSAALIRGTLSRDGEGELATQCIATKDADEWRIAALVALRGDGSHDELPAAAARIIADLEADGDTGMQAALRYLAPEGPCVAVVGLAGAPIVISGAEAITQAVSAWAPPQDVEALGDRVVRVSGDAACVSFGSTMVNGANRAYMHNVVALVRVEGKWQIVVFAALTERTVPISPPA
jgi:ketosteroid isomerase-like protein